MPIKLVIFDLDGTLVDTVQDITNALNHALFSYDIKTLTVKETTKLVGEGVTRLVEKVLPEGKEHLKDDVMRKFLGYYSEHLIENSKEYPMSWKHWRILICLRKQLYPISGRLFQEDCSKNLT